MSSFRSVSNCDFCGLPFSSSQPQIQQPLQQHQQHQYPNSHPHPDPSVGPLSDCPPESSCDTICDSIVSSPAYISSTSSSFVSNRITRHSKNKQNINNNNSHNQLSIANENEVKKRYQLGKYGLLSMNIT